MRGLKLIRRMEAAGLIRWFPEEGKPVAVVEDGSLRRYWTEGVTRDDGGSIWYYDSPDDEFPSMGTNKKALGLVVRAFD